jgi:hypothetical protein
LLAVVNGENVFTAQNGFWFQLNSREKQKAGTPWGPANPQVLNRYSYVSNAPLRYTDPSGHATICTEGYTQCAGAVVQNNSNYDIYIIGDLVSADGTLRTDVIILLQAGMSSVELGVVDVDKIVLLVSVEALDSRAEAIGDIPDTETLELDVNDGRTYSVENTSDGYSINGATGEWKSEKHENTPIYDIVINPVDLSTTTEFVNYPIRARINAQYLFGRHNWRDCSQPGQPCGLPPVP